MGVSQYRILKVALLGISMETQDTRKSSARIRYNLLATILMLFLIGCGLTFFYLLLGPAFIFYKDPQSISGPNIHLISSTAIPDSDLFQKSLSIRALIIQSVNEHASWIVTGWFVWMLGQTAWMSSGIFRINQFHHQKVSPVPAYWKEKIAKLSARLGIKRDVTLIESGIIKTPVVAGHFKPFILVPLGMLTSLPADQVETVLLHELAHVFRRDYLTNLLLHFTERVFIFNPSIRWVIALIGQEREACCDDIVLNTMEGKTHAYLEALLAFEVYAIGDLRLGIPLAGRKTICLHA